MKIAAFVFALMISSVVHTEPFVFGLQPIGWLVEQVNRVNSRKIKFADSGAALHLIQGRYEIDQHPEHLAFAIQVLYSDLEVIQTESGWIVRTRTH